MRARTRAAGLFPLLDMRWRSKIFRGGLVLLIPVVGWPAVLGYRTRFVQHLFQRKSEALPAWEEGFGGFVRDGLRAMGVIFGYLAPLYACVFGLVLARGWEPDRTTFFLTAWFILFPIFSTLSLPIACVAFASSSERWLTIPEASAAFALYVVVIFVIPAGFLQVSRTGRYRDAFALWVTLPFLLRHLRAYVAAWWHSCVMSVVGHGALALAPWGVVWCYLGILVAFNEILVNARLAPSEGWLQTALVDRRFDERGVFGRSRMHDAAGEAVTVFDGARYAVPLPRCMRST